MKILFLCEGDAETHDSWSGVSRSVVTHLRAAGHTVVTGDVDLYGAARIRVAAGTVSLDRKRWWVRYHLNPSGFRARSTRAAQYVRDAGEDVDVILQVGATFQVPKGTRTPVALYCDSNIVFARKAGPSGYSEAAVLSPAEIEAIRAREEEVYSSAELIFAMSHMVNRSFVEDFGVEPERLMTVHCAPNVPFPELGPSGTAPTEPPTVLFVGRDFDRKGGALLLEAVGQVRERVPDARVRFVGCRPPSDPPPWAEFVGFQSRDTDGGREAMDRFYRTASVFCLPTRFEPFGTSFVEAMGYGLPCVGPDAWAIPEIIVQDETGYLVPPEDPRALTEALIHLLEHPDRARKMGEAGRMRALEHFTWPGITGRMAEALSGLIASEPEAASKGRSQE